MNSAVTSLVTTIRDFVMPAKAGIHEHLKEWMPAFAGMTTLAPIILFQLSVPSMAMATPEPLTLEHCIELVTQGSSSVLKALNLDAAAGERLIQGYLQFLPTLSGSLNFGYQHGNRFSATGAPQVIATDNHGLSYQFTSTLNLFNGLSTSSQLKAALARKDFANLTLKRARQLIALDIVQTFTQALVHQATIKIAQSALDESKARQKVLEEKVKLGVANLSDLSRQEALTSSDEAQLIGAINQEKTDMMLLIQKLRLNIQQEYELVEPNHSALKLPDAFGTESELIALALTNRADLHAARKDSDATSWDVRVAQSEYFPKLDVRFDLFSNARYLSLQSINGTSLVPATQPGLFEQLGSHNYFDIGLSLSWDIFDGWTTPAKVARASTIARNSRIDAEDAERQVILDVRKGLADYQTAVAQLASADTGAVAAQRAYDLVKGRFDEGFSSFTDVATAQAALVNAKAQQVIFRGNVDVQYFALETALGR